MRTLTILSSALLLLASAATPSFAMMSITDVSEKMAKELGIKVRTKASGPRHVWIEVEFKTEGALKGFDPASYSRVEMRLRDGKKTLVNAALQMKQPRPGRVSVQFLAARDQMTTISVMIVVGSGLMPGGGFHLELKDFVELEEIDGAENGKKREPASEHGAPATEADTESE